MNAYSIKNSKEWESLTKCRYVCTCGHTVTMSFKRDRRTCSYCGNTVLSKKGQFKKNLRKKMEELK